MSEQRNDDPRGRGRGPVSRRAALGALGGLGVAGIAAAGIAQSGLAEAATTAARPRPSGSGPGGGTSPTASASPTGTAACTLTPEETEGPYYLNLEMVRKDITESHAGVPLTLRVTVINSTTCAVIPNAALDIWHCDAVGVYSGVTGNTGTFLRGVQLTGSDGVVEFTTIYPGWYVGRAVHIHAKVHIGGTVSATTYTGGHVSHTGQFYFDESITQQIATASPYSSNTTTRTPLSQDGIYNGGGGSGLLTLSPTNGSAYTAGVLATITVGVNPDATPPVT